MWSQFAGFGKVLARYLRDYGGLRSILLSPLFLISLVIALLDYDTWLSGSWVELSQALIPSLLGFSLGTYAILFSLLTGKLKQSLQKLATPDGVSFLAMVNATFFHFIFVQILALMWAFLYAGTTLVDLGRLLVPSFPVASDIVSAMAVVGSFAGFLLLIYSFMLILGAALAVYRLAGIREPGD